MRSVRPTRLAGLIILIAAVPVLAEEGRIPIFEPVLFDHAVQNVSGKYVLTREITGSSTAPVIEFRGNGTQVVELDLNGFTVSSTGAASLIVAGDNLRKFVVRNGTILGNAVGTGLYGEAVNFIAEDVTVEDVDTGIYADSNENFAIRRCLVDGTTIHGILVVGDATSKTFGLIEDNNIRNVDTTGIQTFSNVDGVTVRSNRVSDIGCGGCPYSRGMRIDAATAHVEDNQVSEAVNIGIDLVLGGGRVTDNLARDCGNGLVFGSSVGAANGVIISGNVAINNNAGIVVYSTGNLIERNVLNQNTFTVFGTGHGLRFMTGATDNIYRLNTYVGNDVDCVQDLNDPSGNFDNGDNFCRP